MTLPELSEKESYRLAKGVGKVGEIEQPNCERHKKYTKSTQRDQDDRSEARSGAGFDGVRHDHHRHHLSFPPRQGGKLFERRPPSLDAAADMKGSAIPTSSLFRLLVRG
jgi:hypothetical protein